MTINVVNFLKSKTAKTFDKSKIGRDLYAGERFPSADVSLHPGKKVFKFGTTTTVVDDNLSKSKPLEHVKAVHPSSLLNTCADIHVEKKKEILSKVKLAKINIAKLFKPTGRVSAVVPYIDPFAIPSVEHDATNDHSSTLSSPPILQHAKPNACVITMNDSTPPRQTNLETIASPVAHGEDVVNERVKDWASFCSLAETSLPPSTGQLFTAPESQLSISPSTPFLGELHTIEEDDENAKVVVGVANAERKELATFGSCISRSNSDSEVTTCLSSGSLSDNTTTRGFGLVNSETTTSPVDTSLATSIDAEDSHQSLPGALRGLRRVPGYEDLRNSQTIANRDFSRSNTSWGASDRNSSYKTPAFNVAPPRKSLYAQKSSISLEPKVGIPTTRQMNKYTKFRTWLDTRCHKSSRHVQRTSASRAPSETLEVIPVFRLQRFFHPLPRMQTHVFKPSPHQPSLSSSPPIWSCARITRSGLKVKKRRRMTNQSTKELRVRLDSIDIGPWY